MSTVNLTCTHCGIVFSKNKHEVSRRKRKLPNCENWFCSRSCAASHRNLTVDKTHWKKLFPQHGNNYRQVYPEGIGWYVTRVTRDSRASIRLVEEKTSRREFAEHIHSIFNGRCRYTEKPIFLAPLTSSNNPFEIASLDRIDCSRPYEIGNVQWVSRAMNLARNNCDDEFFFNYTAWLRDKTL